MKKQIWKQLLSVGVCMLLLCGLALPVWADGLIVTFTSDSLPEVGGQLTVDKAAMLGSGSITAEEYNALLEGNVIYSWYKNDMLTQEGTGSAQTYQLTLSDQGCTIYVKLSFYADSSFQESKKCGEAVSGKLTITGAAPKITTSSLPDATVGKTYYVKLACSDGDAVFSEIMGSQLSEFGLYLTQHGEIEGTPSKTGNCHVNVLAVSEGGGEDSTSFDITVCTADINAEVEATTAAPTAAPTEAPTQPAPAQTQQPTEMVQEDQTGDGETRGNLKWLMPLAVILVAVGAGVGLAMILTRKKP